MSQITHANGKKYELELLARYMEFEEREEISSSYDGNDGQGFWDAFAARFPESAEHLGEITPPVFENEI